jgi:hypothetical protein
MKRSGDPAIHSPGPFESIANLRRILLEARKIHSRQDYTRMAEPILIEIQQREQEVIEFSARELEQPVWP